MTPSERRRRLVFSRQQQLLRKLSGTPAGARLGRWLAATAQQQQAAAEQPGGCVGVAALREGLAQHGLLLSDADCASCAIGIDPANAGARVRVALVMQQLRGD